VTASWLGRPNVLPPFSRGAEQWPDDAVLGTRVEPHDEVDTAFDTLDQAEEFVPPRFGLTRRRCRAHPSVAESQPRYTKARGV
jgi:hypothetical protein